MLKTKEIEGITLISLVITIIILLILARNKISMLTGENRNIEKKTAQAKEETILAQEKEKII
ncbi:MAG: hypothetical protein ACLS9A_08690 [Clostridia bacterium]